MPLVINDGKGTPVAHSFTQDAQQNGSDPAEFVNRSNVNGPSFWERLRGWATIATKASAPHVVKVTLNRPIAGTVSGNPAVLGSHKSIVTFLIDQAVSAESDVLDTVAMTQNLLANATIRGQIKSFAPFVVP